LYIPTTATAKIYLLPTYIDTTRSADCEFVKNQPCTHPDSSSSTVVYATKTTLDAHSRRAHKIPSREKAKHYPSIEIAPFLNTGCLHADCSGKGQYYQTSASYKTHLKSKHGLSETADVNPLQLWWKIKYPRGAIARTMLRSHKIKIHLLFLSVHVHHIVPCGCSGNRGLC
jgi:hypothetical protein